MLNAASLQKNDLPDAWTWTSDANGKIVTISGQFSVMFGASATKQIVGSTFWGFCEGLTDPNADWKELGLAIREKRRIKKFVFSYNIQGKFLKVKITGLPVFDKGRFLGHQGTGQLCDEDEFTSSEISQNSLSMALDSLNIGIAFFDESETLQDYNDSFAKLLIPAGVGVKKAMTLSTILSHMKARNLVHAHFEVDGKYGKEQEILIEIRHVMSVLVKISSTSQGGVSLKIESVDNIAKDIKKNKEQMQHFKEENSNMAKRLEEYKCRLEGAMKNSKQDHSQENDKLISFFENQMDVGILITDLEGKPLSTNYFLCELFHFRTSKEFLASTPYIYQLRGYDPLWKDTISEMMANKISRFEREIEVTILEDRQRVKEVVSIYPSVISPQKVISFFYPIEYIDTYETQNHKALYPQGDSGDAPEKSPNDNMIGGDFIHYLMNNIKTSLQVITGYSDLNKMNHHLPEDISLKNSEYIAQSCQNILEQIHEIGYLYNATQGIQDFQFNRVNPEKIIEKLCQNIHKDIQNKNIDLTLDIQNNPFDIICDENILSVAFQKVMDIAVLISRDHSHLRVRLKVDTQNHKLSIVIADEGGLHLENIFLEKENMQMVNNQNIAFGMRVSKTLLEKMDFEFHITSFVGLGNTVIITAPSELLAIRNAHKDDLAV